MIYRYRISYKVPEFWGDRVLTTVIALPKPIYRKDLPGIANIIGDATCPGENEDLPLVQIGSPQLLDRAYLILMDDIRQPRRRQPRRQRGTG